MSKAIHVASTSLGTAQWHAEVPDGTYLCDIRFELSAFERGSRYYVLRNGKLLKEGTFTFEVWDKNAAHEIVTAILQVMFPGATVTFKP